MDMFGCIVVSVDRSGREAIVDRGDGSVAKLVTRQNRFVLRHDVVRGTLTHGGRRRLYNASRDWWFEARVEALSAEAMVA